MSRDPTNNDESGAVPRVRLRPCCVCGTKTDWWCSGCEVAGHGSVYVCTSAACQARHDADDERRGTPAPESPVKACAACAGTGMFDEWTCGHCDGSGKERALTDAPASPPARRDPCAPRPIGPFSRCQQCFADGMCDCTGCLECGGKGLAPDGAACAVCAGKSIEPSAPSSGESFPRCSQCCADGACNCTGLCPACNGRGVSPDGAACATCAGYGTEPRQLANLRRPTSVPKLQRCTVCRGTGATDGVCCACGGTGRVLEWAAMPPPSSEPSPFSDAVLDRATAIARISLAFGRVNRITRHEDGVRPETDTDHTVMLTLVAMDIAPNTLNLGMVAAYSSVHDLVEVYAFDTQTMVISPEALAEKREREKAALDRLVEEFGRDSWLSWLLQTYEAQRVPEARFVRLVDKILPGLTHALNACAAALPIVDRDGFIAAGANQLRQLSADYPEFPAALDLLRRSIERAESRWPAHGAREGWTGQRCSVCHGPGCADCGGTGDEYGPINAPAAPTDASRSAILGADTLRAALEPAEPPCTGSSATWCPRCGDCACALRFENDPDGERTLSDDGCPLHSARSPHAEAEVASLCATANRDSALRMALSRMGVADCDDPIAALNSAIDDMEQRERVATDERNALVMERDKLRRDLSDARPLSWLWRPGDDE